MPHLTLTLMAFFMLLLNGCASKRQHFSAHTDSVESTARYDHSLIISRIDSVLSTIDFSFDYLEVKTQGSAYDTTDSCPSQARVVGIVNGRLTASRSEKHNLNASESLRDSINCVEAVASSSTSRTDFSAVYSPSAFPWLLVLALFAIGTCGAWLAFFRKR